MRVIETAPALDISEIDTQIIPSRAPLIRASAVRIGWQSRYAVTLCLIDLLVGLCAASWALVLRFGPERTQPYLRDYLVLTLLFPIAWIAALGINRAYESRHLFVGTDEYARVFRSGIGLTACIASISRRAPIEAPSERAG